jgi:hypothetical protein
VLSISLPKREEVKARRIQIAAEGAAAVEGQKTQKAMGAKA